MNGRAIGWALFAAAVLATVVLAPDEPTLIEPARVVLAAGQSPQASRSTTVRATDAAADAGLTILPIRPRESDTAGANPFPVQPMPARPRPVVHAPPPLPPAASAPQAPPIPFQVVGRFVDDKREAVFLVHGDQTLVARVGDTLVGSYQVESLSPFALTLMYIPLGVRQTLPIAPSP